MDIPAAIGAESSYGREHVAAVDCTEIGLHPVVVVTIGGCAKIIYIDFLPSEVAPDKPEETGVEAICGDDRTEPDTPGKCFKVASPRISFYLEPLIDT